MTGKLPGSLLVLAGTLLLCLQRSRLRRRETALLQQLSAALMQLASGIRWQQRSLPWLLRQESRRPLAGPFFRQVLLALERDTSLSAAWTQTFSVLPVGEAAQLLCQVALCGDETLIIGSLQDAAGQLNALARARQQAQHQQDRLLWTAALSGAGLFIILLI